MKNLKKILPVIFLFLLTSIPIITIPTSICSAFSCYYKILKKENFKIKEVYLKSFKNNFFQSIVLSIIIFFLYAILFRYFLVNNPKILFIITSLFLLIYLYTMSLISRYNLNNNDAFKNAILILLINGVNSLLLIFIQYILIFILMFSFTNIYTFIPNFILFDIYLYIFAKLTIGIYIEKFEINYED